MNSTSKLSMALRHPGLSTAAAMGIAALSLAAYAATAYGDAGDGNPQFDQYCIACHGADARGIENLGVNLLESRFVAGKSEAQLVEFLQQGRLPDDPASLTGRPMPGFSWVTEGELQAIAAFLKAQGSKTR